MRLLRRTARVVLLALFFLSVVSLWLRPPDYAAQSRNDTNAAPSRRFPLGTDDLGRDRFSRLIYGTRLSLLLAPAAAAIALAVSVVVGGSAGLAGGWWDRIAMRTTDLFLSLPWLFLFLTARAVLPLNTSPSASILVTFAVMGLLGWAAAARVIRAAVIGIRQAPFAAYARALGCSNRRIWLVHLLPHLRVVLLAQFWLAVPAFILGEASLGLLGLGVSDPLPSWGNLLRELETVPSLREYWILTPVLLLTLVMACFQLVLPRKAQP